jgi:hypothetical protein
MRLANKFLFLNKLKNWRTQMSNSTQTFLMATLLFSVVSQAAGEKAYYAKVTPAVRTDLVSKMHTRKILAPLAADKKVKEDEKDNVTNKIDMVQFLSEKCDFNYTRDNANNPIRPHVECTYTPRPADNDFNGATSKFDCAFPETDSEGRPKLDKDGKQKIDVRKVKYAPQKFPGGGYKEIPQAVLGTAFARLLGFATSTYCPVDLTCLNCPNENPWALDRARGAAVEGNKVIFENVVVEAKQKGTLIEDNIKSNQSKKQKPQGFTFKELSQNVAADPALRGQLIAEREALALWQNFIRHEDADQHNNKLLCVKSTEMTATSAPVCEQVVGTLNDYGNSFGYRGEGTRLSVNDFSGAALKRNFFGGGAVATGADGDSGVKGYAISRAGRDLFVTYADAITQQQLSDIFQLAQITQTSDGNLDQWIQSFRKKVEEIKAVKIK